MTGAEMYCEGMIWKQEQAISALLVVAPQVDLSGDWMTLRSSGHSARLKRFNPRQQAW